MEIKEVMRRVETHNTVSGFWKAIRESVLKQVPKNVVMSESFRTGYCPVCNSNVYMDIGFVFKKDKYCENCGQKLKYEDLDYESY